MMESFVGNGVAIIIGSIYDDPQISALMAPFIVLPFFVFGGFYSNYDT